MSFLRCLVVDFFLDSCLVFDFLLVKEGGDPVLSPELLPCFFRKVVNYLTSESNAGHGVKYDFVRDHVAYSKNLTL